MFIKLKNLALKIMGKVFLYLFYTVLVIFYLTLFQVPVPFIADTVANVLQQKYASQMKIIDKVQVGGVSLAWNYEINRPIILIRDISYISSNNITKLSKIGFYPNITDSIKEKTLFIEKIYVEGLNIAVKQVNQDEFSINLKNITSIEGKKNSQKISSNDNSLSNTNYSIENAYFYMKSVKNLAPVLKYLNELNISKSKLIFQNKNKQSLLLNLKYLSFVEKKNIVVNINSSLIFSSNTNRKSNIKGRLLLNSKEEVSSNLEVQGLYLEQASAFFSDLFKNDLSKHLVIKDLKSDISIKSLYNLGSGLQNIKGKLKVASGSVMDSRLFDKSLNINQIRMDIGYNSKNDDINLNNLVIMFKAKNSFFLKNLGIGTNISQVLVNSKINLNTKEISLYKSFIIANGMRLNVSADYNYLNLNNKILNISTNMNQIKLSDLINIWPKKVVPDVKEWVRTSIKIAKVDKLSMDAVLSFTPTNMKLDQISSKMLLSDLNLVYIPGMPTIQSKDVVFESDNSNITVTFFKAQSELLKFSKGFVKIFDYSSKPNYQPGVYVDLDLESAKIPDLLNYINKDGLQLLKDTSINIDDISGNASGNMNLLYALDSQQVENLSGDFVATDIIYKNVFKDKNITNGNLNIFANKTSLSLNGSLSFLDNATDVDIEYNWGSGKTISTYVINTKQLDIAKIYQLDLIDEDILNKISGVGDFSITYKDSGATSNINLKADLKQSLLHLKEFDYTKKVGLPLLLNTNIVLLDNQLSNINGFRLYNDDMNIVMDLRKRNNGSTNINFSQLFINNKADASVNILFKENSTNLLVRGNFLDATSIVGILKNQSAKKSNSESNSISQEEDTPKNKTSNNEDVTLGITDDITEEKIEYKIIDNFDESLYKIEIDDELLQADNLIENQKENASANQEDETNLNNQIITSNNKEKEDILEPKTEQDNPTSEVGAENTKGMSNYNIDIKLNNMISNGVNLSNVMANLIIIDTVPDYIDFSYYTNNRKNYIFYNSKEQGLLLEIRNLGDFFNFFEVKSRITNGFLTVKASINRIFDAQTKKYVFISKGTASVSNFSIYLALGFSSADIDFTSKGYYFNLANINLTGNFIGGHMSGYLDYDKKILDITGKLIPIWSANHIISNAPIIKTLLGNNNSTDHHSLLQVNVEIKGPLEDLQYFVFSRDKKSGKLIKTLDNDDLLQEEKQHSNTVNNPQDDSVINNKDSAENLPNTAEKNTNRTNDKNVIQNKTKNESDTPQTSKDSNLGKPLDIGSIDFEKSQYIHRKKFYPIKLKLHDKTESTEVTN